MQVARNIGDRVVGNAGASGVGGNDWIIGPGRNHLGSSDSTFTGQSHGGDAIAIDFITVGGELDTGEVKRIGVCLGLVIGCDG